MIINIRLHRYNVVLVTMLASVSLTANLGYISERTQYDISVFYFSLIDYIKMNQSKKLSWEDNVSCVVVEN